MTTSEIATVLAWHDALNAGDFDTLVQVSSDDIEFGDANGAGQGHEALREWATSLGVTAADPGRMYVRDGFVVTLWTYYESVPPREVAPAEYAHALERLHAGMRAIMSPRCSDTPTCAPRWPRPT